MISPPLHNIYYMYVYCESSRTFAFCASRNALTSASLYTRPPKKMLCSQPFCAQKFALLTLKRCSKHIITEL